LIGKRNIEEAPQMTGQEELNAETGPVSVYDRNLLSTKQHQETTQKATNAAKN